MALTVCQNQNCSFSLITLRRSFVLYLQCKKRRIRLAHPRMEPLFRGALQPSVKLTLPCGSLSQLHIAYRLSNNENNSSSGTAETKANTTELTSVQDQTAVFSDTGPVLAPSEQLLGKDRTVEGAFGDEDHIDDFFGRPVRLFSFKVSPGVPFLAQLYAIWDLYMQDPNVKKKLANFNNLRANLKLKFLINGTPSHAGRFLVSYKYIDSTPMIIGNNLRKRTQRPNLHLDPTTSQGGEMTLPFLWRERAFHLKDMYDNSKWSEVGHLHLEEFSTLIQLSAGVDPISISCYGTLENVELGVPTTWVPQAGKRKKKGLSRVDENQEEQLKVSTVASAIADGADMMSQLPVVGIFAKATSIAARGIGGIAALFGFSRPVSLEDIKPVRQVPFGDLASATGKEIVAKLTLDPKQEITVDSRVIGLDGTDELSMQFLTRKWSYVSQVEWSPTDAVDHELFKLKITPMMCDAAAITPAGTFTAYAPSVLAYVSRMFEFWSGDIEVKLEFVMSAYHRGRLALHYDPNDIGTGNLDNVTYTEFIDVNANSASLKGGRTTTFNIGMKVNRNYLGVSEDIQDCFGAATAFDETQHNGTISLNVVTDLAVPDAVSPVTVLIFVRAGENFRLLGPRGSNVAKTSFTWSPPAQEAEQFEAQSGRSDDANRDENATVSDLTMSRQRDRTADQELDLVIGGEHFNSFRQLLRRYNFLTAMQPCVTGSPKGANGVYFGASLTFGPMWPPYGYADPSMHRTPANSKINYVHTTSMSYLEQCYAAWRGARRYKLTYLTDGGGTITAERVEGTTGYSLPTSYDYAITTAETNSEKARYVNENTDNGGSGANLTIRRSLNAVEVEVPYYGPSRFSRTGQNWVADNAEDSYNGVRYIFTDNSEDWNNSTVQFYTAAGEDFNFHGFTGAPQYFIELVSPP